MSGEGASINDPYAIDVVAGERHPLPPPPRIMGAAHYHLVRADRAEDRIRELEQQLEESRRGRGATCPGCCRPQAVPGGSPTPPGTIFLSVEEGQ